MVAAPEQRALEHQVRELQGLLSKKTSENEVLRDALAQPKLKTKSGSACRRRRSPPGSPSAGISPLTRGSAERGEGSSNLALLFDYQKSL